MVKNKVSQVLRVALGYAENGWHVLPVRANSKVPATAHGYKDATTNADQLIDWFAGCKYNIGVATGRTSELFVVDLDLKNGADGVANWAKVKKEYGFCDDTYTVKTPTGGLHIYYSIDSKCHLPCGIGLRPGIDTRADGGYVVAPPSTIDGSSYEIINSKPPIPCPKGLKKFVADSKKRVKKSAIGVVSVTEGTRNDTCFRLAMSLRKKGCSEEEINAKCVEFAQNCEPPLSEPDALRCVQSSKNYCRNQVVVITNSNHNEVIDKCLGVLADFCDCFVTVIEPTQLVTLKKGFSGLSVLDAEGLRYILNESIMFTIVGKDEEAKVVSCPTWVVNGLLSPIVNQSLNKIRGLTSVPIFHKDWSVVDTNGYDPISQYYFYSEKPYLINQQPTDVQVKKAFQETLHFFRFYQLDALSRANLLSALLATILLPVLRTIPIFGITSPYAGSGKTMLGQCISFLVEESENCSAMPKNEEEMNKEIIAVLLSRHHTVLFDNKDGVLESPTLCGIVTSGFYMGRKLKVNELVEGAYQVITMVTGKNLVIAEDLFRRTLKIVCESRSGKPENDTFAFNPLVKIKKYRTRIISALFTLVFAYKNAGAPRQSRSVLQSFEEFDQYVRQLVLWLAPQLEGWNLTKYELGDPIDSIAKNREESEIISDSSALVAALYARYRDQEFTSNDVDHDSLGSWATETERDLNKNLRDSLINCLGNPNSINSRRIGRYILANLKNKICEIVDVTDRKLLVKLTMVGKKQNKTIFKIVFS